MSILGNGIIDPGQYLHKAARHLLKSSSDVGAAYKFAFVDRLHRISVSRMTIFASLVGGIGLFLLGMSMMTDGLKVAAGPTLKSILGSWTSSAPRGLLAGVFITAIVQSSSATTVAVIGFVNAGILNLTQAVWVVFGANFGTTTTGWMVALLGLKVSMTALGLPMVGAGMLLRLIAGERVRLAGLGGAFAGFGAFFMGIGILQDAFTGLAPSITDLALDHRSITGLLGFVLIGVILTLTTQSSSAAIAITLSAVMTGAVGLYPGAAIIIGANVGTTSTAIFAALGGTAAARRTALSHVAFSLLAATAAFLALPIYLWMSGNALSLIGLAPDDATRLAAFHTLLNLFGVVLIWPFAPFLVKMLSRLFASSDDEIARPRHLDANVTGMPDLATSGLYLETRRAMRHCMAFAQDQLEDGPMRGAEKRRMPILALMTEIRGFVDKATAHTLSEYPGRALPELVRALQHGEELLELHPGDAGTAGSDAARTKLAGAVHDCLQLPPEGEDSKEALIAYEHAAEEAYDSFKDELLGMLASGAAAVSDVDRALAWAQTLKRIGYVARRARRRLIRAAALTGAHLQKAD